jgi:hypothetical protein
VIRDGVLADEQLSCDLGVGLALGGKLSDLLLLSGELIAELGVASACMLSGREQLDAGPVAESIGAHRLNVVCDSQLLARIPAAASTAQPLPVEQVAPRDLGDDARLDQVPERLLVERLGVLV